MQIVLAYIEDNGRVLITRRPAGVHLAGYWEFPGGKVEPGESFPDALQRELREEIGTIANVAEEIATTTYHYADRCVELHLLRCTLQGEPLARQVAALRWVPADELRAYCFPPANAALLAALPLPESDKGGPSCQKG